MSSTYSPSLKIELIGNGDQSGTWGTTTNNNLGTLLEQAITGVQAITMSNADYTLSNYNGTSDEARNAVLFVSGTNSAIRKIVAPQGQNKLYTIFNNTSGGYAITIGAPTGTPVTIPSGVTATVFTDGSNFYSAQTGSAGDFTVNGTLTATGVTDTGNLSVGGSFTATSGTVTIGSGAITGTMTAPTQSVGDNSTKIATTAYVNTATGSLGTMATQNANAVAITGGSINGIYPAIPVASGGTGITSLTANSVVLGNGTSSVQTVAPGITGNVLTSNGTTWASTTPASTQPGTSITVYWVNGNQVTAGRSGATVYQNTSGKTRFVLVAYSNSAGYVYVDNVNGATTAISYNQAGGGAPWNTTFFLVPDGYYYQVPSGGYFGWTEWQ